MRWAIQCSLCDALFVAASDAMLVEQVVDGHGKHVLTHTWCAWIFGPVEVSALDKIHVQPRTEAALYAQLYAKPSMHAKVH